MDFKKLNKLADKDPEYVAEVIITNKNVKILSDAERADDYIKDLAKANLELLNKKHTTEDDYILINRNCECISAIIIIAHFPEELGNEAWKNYITKTRAKHIYVTDAEFTGDMIPITPDVAKDLIQKAELSGTLL